MAAVHLIQFWLSHVHLWYLGLKFKLVIYIYYVCTSVRQLAKVCSSLSASIFRFCFLFSFLPYWKCNFPLSPHVRLLVGWLVGLSCNSFIHFHTTIGVLVSLKLPPYPHYDSFLEFHFFQISSLILIPICNSIWTETVT